VVFVRVVVVVGVVGVVVVNGVVVVRVAVVVGVVVVGVVVVNGVVVVRVVVVVGVVVVVVVGVVVDTPPMITWPLTTVAPIACPLMLPTITFERVRALVPEFIPAVILIIARVPMADTVSPGVVITSATPVNEPVVLFIVPGMK
jgi:hypothetical protein